MVSDMVNGADGVFVADMDNDGAEDLVTAWEAGHRVMVHYPAPGWTDYQWPARTVTSDVAVVGANEGAIADDLDGDGWQDVIAFSQNSTTATSIHLSNAGTSWDSYLLVSGTGGRYLTGTTADIDGDGLRDIIAGAATYDLVAFTHPGYALADDPDAWSPSVIIEARWVMSVHGDDVDGDGDVDLMVSWRSTTAGQPDTGLAWFENGTTGGHNGTWTPHQIISGEGTRAACRGDLDDDGDVDYAVGGGHDGLFWWVERVPTFPYFTAHMIAPPFEVTNAGWKGCAIADIDGDSALDIVATTGKGNAPSVWWAEGPGWTWHAVDDHWDSTKIDNVVTMDVDADGDLDIIAPTEQPRSEVRWYENPRL